MGVKTIKSILLFLLFFINISYAVNCETHPIYCKIKKLRPDMPYKEAMNLSNIVYKKSQKYHGDPILAIAIAMQETGLKQINRKQSIIKFKKECENDECQETYIIYKGVSDVCMFQIHVNTVINYDIDPIKLKNDLSYCIDWHFKIMNIKKQTCKKLGNEAWSCYHSTNKMLRKQYIKLVGRFL